MRSYKRDSKGRFARTGGSARKTIRASNRQYRTKEVKRGVKVALQATGVQNPTRRQVKATIKQSKKHMNRQYKVQAKTNRKIAKVRYKKAKASSRAKHSNDVANISKMSDAQYNRYIAKGTYAGQKIFGQDLMTAADSAKTARDKKAKADYRIAKRALV